MHDEFGFPDFRPIAIRRQYHVFPTCFSDEREPSHGEKRINIVYSQNRTKDTGVNEHRIAFYNLNIKVSDKTLSDVGCDCFA